ncbi:MULTISPECIES: hypothetical protein [Thermomonosporaceae]|uniref:hypothetical protein n=1 Tax=Thermomonosporaceae TaxID=2012 RepID=UPI00255AE26A|nr:MULTISPECIES: hypothetical protein [Thermomonosporaceae]MDL4777486.1 hypothetical protein [Actinomadura xylanilytica]
MSEATGTFHLAQPRLQGPAERTLVQPWLTEMSNLALNAYAETAPPPARALAVVEALSAATVPPERPSRVALAA